MKKITISLLAFVASMCSLTAWAGRVAPTMPASVTPVSGQTYYLYNVDEGLFLTLDDDSDPYLGVQGRPVTVTIDEKGMLLNLPQQKSEYSRRLCVWQSSFIGRSSYGDTDNHCYFTIAETGDGSYLIQVASCNTTDYNENQYVGGKNGEKHIYHNMSSDASVHWKFIVADDPLAGALMLYIGLEKADIYGYNVDDYEQLYAHYNEHSSDELMSAVRVLNNALENSIRYKAPWWNEQPVLFWNEEANIGDSNGWYYVTSNDESRNDKILHANEQNSLCATVSVNEPSAFIYSLSGWYHNESDYVAVYVDGVQTRNLLGRQCNNSSDDYERFTEYLEAGVHTIKWVSNGDRYISSVGVMACPLISVSLLEPGSLGTEVLYNTDHIKNVRRLKVKGAMNDDDWAKIKMMSTLLELDLSEAQSTEVPKYQFRVWSYAPDTTMQFLHKVILPEGLTKINSEAFSESFVEEVIFPSTLQSIGYQAFYNSHIREVDMPDNLTEFGERIFRDAYWLNKANLPKNLTTIPYDTFESCYYLNNVTLPEKLETIDSYAFHECHNLQTTLPIGLKTVGSRAFEGCWNFYPRLPEGLTTIRNAAFNTCNAMDSLVVPASVTTIEEYAFCNCQNLKYAELSVSQYTTPKAIFDNTPKLEVLKLNSATVVNPTIDGSTYPHRKISQLTLKVPHYLVNSYKLHSYWYNAKAIEPFDYSSMDFIPLNGNLTLNHERFGGQPSIHVQYNCFLKINGDAEQRFNEIWISNNTTNGKYGQLLNNCNQITAIGDNRLDYYTEAQKWYFISLPFDLDVSRITTWTSDGQFAIRYYDGEGRAANGKSGNWKNVEPTSIIPAGTGFIYQTNIGTWTLFYAADTENKYGTLRTTEFTKSLAVNASETASNQGWNLVGNPYQCFYNNHALNFTAPITVWNTDNRTYTAYSLTDDDYAIRPNEAFFVQCPNEEYNTISFPLQGRQLTSVIESQNAVKAMQPQAKNRQVVNLTIGNGEMEDMTRVVLNEDASVAYETSCDASKFMSMETSVPQIYTLDDEGTLYAINERPVGEGRVALGFYAGRDASYTITVSRCDALKVFLTDNLTGETTDLTSGTYTFSAKAGTDNTRFTLNFISSDATALREISEENIAGKADVYSVDGKFLGNDASHLGAGVYVIRKGTKASKVIVR